MDQHQVEEKELKIFKYQFVLNYMSKPTCEAKMKYMLSFYEVSASNYRELVFKELLPTVKYRLQAEKTVGNVRVTRTSKFMENEVTLIT